MLSGNVMQLSSVRVPTTARRNRVGLVRPSYRASNKCGRCLGRLGMLMEVGL